MIIVVFRSGLASLGRRQGGQTGTEVASHGKVLGFVPWLHTWSCCR